MNDDGLSSERLQVLSILWQLRRGLAGARLVDDGRSSGGSGES